ncbi:MAG: response regulator transcription factor [Sphingomonadaceae bacterium]
MTTEQRTVFLVDDEDSVRRSVGFMLKTAGYLVRPFPSGVAFLKEIRPEDSGCVLLDVRMPEMDGIEVQAALATRGIATPVIVFTGHGDVSVAVRAMKAGAVDFIEKPFERTVLLDAIAAAFDRLEDLRKHETRASDAMIKIAALTPREQDVLKGLAHGLPNKTIGYDLGISPRTVEVHRANLMDKLGVASFPEALRIAFAAGLGAEWD